MKGSKVYSILGFRVPTTSVGAWGEGRGEGEQRGVKGSKRGEGKGERRGVKGSEGGQRGQRGVKGAKGSKGE